jgi:cytochrome P450
MDYVRGYDGRTPPAAARRPPHPHADLRGRRREAQRGGGGFTTILLLNAGHEATVHQAGNAVRPSSRSGLDRDAVRFPAQTAATVEECLRFDAPLHLFTRYAYETMEVAPDVTVKSASTVGLLLGMANRDPRAFIEPDAFNPDRTDGQNVSFGAGIHFCIGAPLARIELQEALKVLFDRLPFLRFAAPPRYKDVFHFHGLEALSVEW